MPQVDDDELRRRYGSVFGAHWDDFLAGRIDFGQYRWNRLREAVAPWAELDDALFLAYREEKRRSVERLRPFDDAVPTIARLREGGLRIGLLTNGPSSLQRRKLEVTGLAGELDGIAISEEIGVAKPDARAFRVAAALIDLAPGDVAMVGDSPAYDIAGAIGAGLAAAVLIGDSPPEAEGALAARTLAEVPGSSASARRAETPDELGGQRAGAERLLVDLGLVVPCGQHRRDDLCPARRRERTTQLPAVELDPPEPAVVPDPQNAIAEPLQRLLGAVYLRERGRLDRRSVG